jgi:hypothetical protein
MAIIDVTVAGEMMEIMQSSAEENGVAWTFYKTEDYCHIEIRHVEKDFLVGTSQGDSFEAAWNKLTSNVEQRHQAALQECFRGAFLNFLGKAAFGYFGCAAIAQPLQDSRRPTP